MQLVNSAEEAKIKTARAKMMPALTFALFCKFVFQTKCPRRSLNFKCLSQVIFNALQLARFRGRWVLRSSPCKLRLRFCVVGLIILENVLLIFRTRSAIQVYTFKTQYSIPESRHLKDAFKRYAILKIDIREGAGTSLPVDPCIYSFKHLSNQQMLLCMPILKFQAVTTISVTV